MKRVSAVGLLLLAFVFPKEAYSYRGLEDDRTSDAAHGLYEINEEAKKFLQEEEARTHVRRKSLGPNLKVFVPPCSVPLKAAQAPKSMGLSNEYTVLVSCERSASKYENNKGWSVGVPTSPLE